MNGLRAIAVPISNPDGTIYAGLGLAGGNVPLDDLNLIYQVQAASMRISTRLASAESIHRSFERGYDVS